jgi:hypothetical protein
MAPRPRSVICPHGTVFMRPFTFCSMNSPRLMAPPSPSTIVTAAAATVLDVAAAERGRVPSLSFAESASVLTAATTSSSPSLSSSSSVLALALALSRGASPPTAPTPETEDAPPAPAPACPGHNRRCRSPPATVTEPSRSSSDTASRSNTSTRREQADRGESSGGTSVKVSFQVGLMLLLMYFVCPTRRPFSSSVAYGSLQQFTM